MDESVWMVIMSLISLQFWENSKKHLKGRWRWRGIWTAERYWAELWVGCQKKIVPGLNWKRIWYQICHIHGATSDWCWNHYDRKVISKFVRAFFRTFFLGILPGLELSLLLETSSDDYRLICGEKGWNLEDQVIMEIGECHLVVPVGQLHPKVYFIFCRVTRFWNPLILDVREYWDQAEENTRIDVLHSHLPRHQDYSCRK